MKQVFTKRYVTVLAFFATALLTIAFCSPIDVMAQDEVLPAEVETPTSGNTLLYVKGTYYMDSQKVLNRINEIRYEACVEGVPDPRDRSRALTLSDYKPLKWSTELEQTARLRAAEASIAVGQHSRLNGKSVWTADYNGADSYSEDLAWNGGTDPIFGIIQFYEEKSDWVNNVSGAVTGHYTSIINPSFSYVGVGDFYADSSVGVRYDNTLALRLGYSTKSTQPLPTYTNCYQVVEVSNSYITSVNGSNTTISFGGKSYNLLNKVQVVDPMANFTGVHKDNDGVCRIYKNGVVQSDFTGMYYSVEYDWRYFVNGQMISNYTGMALNEYGWWYFSNGKLDWNYTGMALNEYGWWYFENGQLNLRYTGMALNEYGWWYFENGQLNLTYTGMALNQYGWWYFENGRLNLSYTGMALNQYGWWYFENGQLNLRYTGMALNEYGWWYFENGQINLTYTGPAHNQYGNWYFVNGRLAS